MSGFMLPCRNLSRFSCFRQHAKINLPISRPISYARNNLRLLPKFQLQTSYFQSTFSQLKFTEENRNNSKSKWIYLSVGAAGMLVILAVVRVGKLIIIEHQKENSRLVIPGPYSEATLAQILNTSLVYSMISQPWLVDISTSLMAFLDKIGMTFMYSGIVKATFYKHFCGSSDIEELKSKMRSLKRVNINTMLNYAVEMDEIKEDLDPEEVNQRLSEFAQNVFQVITHVCENLGKEFEKTILCVKVTGITNIKSLEKMNLYLETAPYETLDFLELVNNESNGLDEMDRCAMTELYERLNNLAQLCEEKKLRLAIDAEKLKFQDAIDTITLDLCAKYNSQSMTPVVYNTYQLYLKNGLEKLYKHMTMARMHSFILGAKLVRGAYISSEKRCYIHDTKSETDECYNNAAYECIQEAATRGMGVIIASHNKESIELAVDELKKHNIPSTSFVDFSQLLGMEDSLTLFTKRELEQCEGLKENCGAYKYITFGRVDEVIPYLIRRAEENSSMVDRARSERQVVYRELLKRLKFILFGFN